jgi:dihydrofolate reductase
MNEIPVSIIAAVAKNGVIGNDGSMPWRLATDLRRFKMLTMGKPVVMGRNTFESIGKPLAGRTNIVVSRREGYRPEGVTVAPSLEAGIAEARAAARRAGAAEVFIIGGGEIYAAALPLADRLHITHVAAEPAGDTRFPPLDPSAWVRIDEEIVPAGENDTAATLYAVYERPGDEASR